MYEAMSKAGGAGYEAQWMSDGVIKPRYISRH